MTQSPPPVSSVDSPSLGSDPFRWLFENRKTGAITLVQWPNWSATGWAFSMAIERFVDNPVVDTIAGVASFSFAVFWGATELASGVNPFRKALGAAVILWQLVGLLQSVPVSFSW